MFKLLNSFKARVIIIVFMMNVLMNSLIALKLSVLQIFLISILVTAVFSCLIILQNYITYQKPISLLRNKLDSSGENIEDLSQELGLGKNDDINELAVTVQGLISYQNNSIKNLIRISNSLFGVSQKLIEITSKVETTSVEVGKGVQQVTESVIAETSESNKILEMIRNTKHLIEDGNEKFEITVNNIYTSSRVANQGNEYMVKIQDYNMQLDEFINLSSEKMQKLILLLDEVKVISSTIKEVSEKTNLLALNATIEAARAGEHGRGFSVVAMETLKLADDTKDSTYKIVGIITNLQNEIVEMKNIIENNIDVIKTQINLTNKGNIAFSDIVHQTCQTEKESKIMQEILNGMYRDVEHVDIAAKTTAQLIESTAATAEEVSACVEDQNTSIFGLVSIARDLEVFSDQLENEFSKFSINVSNITKENPYEIRIGLLNSLTGILANAGGLDGYRGQIIAIETINSKGGVLGKYKIVPVLGNDKSDPAVAVSEVERLVNLEKVPIIAGVFGSGLAVKVAESCEKNRVVFWDHIAVADEVLKGKHYSYVFRPVIMGTQRGKGGVDFINSNYALYGAKNPSDLRVAVIYENGPYGTSCSIGNMDRIKAYRMNVVCKESYDKTSKNLKSTVSKLIDAKPDVIFHTGYFDDLCVFLKDAEELKLKTKAMVGFGGGHGMLEDIDKKFNNKITKYMINYDNPVIQLIPKNALSRGLYEENVEFIKKLKRKYGIDNATNYHSAGFAHTMILLKEVFPIALEKYGKITPEIISEICSKLDIQDNCSHAGYGVKFAEKNDEYSGQNLRAFNFAMQWDGNKWDVVFPNEFKTKAPVIPFPKDSIFG